MAYGRTAASDQNILYDQKSGSIMVQGDSQDTLKKKVAEVREVVPNWSKHQITLLLTHFNQNVEETIQAIVEDQAHDILQQWQSTSATNKPSAKKKKNKNKSNNEAQPGDTTSGNTDSGTKSLGVEQNALEQRPDKTRRRRTSSPPTAGKEPRPKEATAIFSNPIRPLDTGGSAESFLSTAAYQSEPEVPFVSQQVNHVPSSFVSENSDLLNSVTSELTMASGGETQKGINTKQASKSTTASSSGGRPHKLDIDVSQSSRERTMSERSTGSASSRKPHGGLERCYKDLQRQTASLQRHKLVISEQMTKSLKELHKIFDQLKEELANREVELMCELNKEKNDGENWLNKRYQTALELKQRLDKVPSMKENDVINLRAEIKHFVSERRIDEDIASTKRFTCDFDSFRSQIQSFGQVIPIKAAYTTRNPSVSSVSSSLMSPDDLLSPSTPHPMTSQNPLNDTDSHSINSSTASKADAPVPVVGAAAKVISQSESLTRYEQLNPEDKILSSTFTRPSRGRGQSYYGRGQARRGQGQRAQPIRDQELKDHAGRGQGPRGPGSRGQSSRGQGFRGEGPRNQGSRGPKLDMRNQGHGDASEQQNSGGNQTSYNKQDMAKRGRNARHRERQQQANKDGARQDKKDAADVKTTAGNHITQNAEAGGDGPQRSGRQQRNSSPRKRSGKGQGQPYKNTEHVANHEANGQQVVKPSGHGDQSQDGKGHGDQGQDSKGHSDLGQDDIGHGDHGQDGKGHNDEGEVGKGHSDQGQDGKGHNDEGQVGKGHSDRGQDGKGHNDEDQVGQGHSDQVEKDEAGTDVSSKIDNEEHSTVSHTTDNSSSITAEVSVQNMDSDRAELATSLTNGHTQEECSSKPDTNKSNSSHRSVVVSVKEQTDQHPITNDHPKDDPLLDGSIESELDSKRDFNTNGMSKTNLTQNGIVEQKNSVKKATVSIEKLNEVTRATISVDSLSSTNGALPQRKGGSRRRNRDHRADDQTDDGSTNGVCDVDS